jgi:hypothetical protein
VENRSGNRFHPCKVCTMKHFNSFH